MTSNDGARAPVRVLFLCTHNSARSQMAEALLRHLGGADFEVESAGTHPGQVHPLAVAAMAARGIDLRGHHSKSLQQFADQAFDYVVTVCDAANQACPIFSGARERLHWSIDDPSALAGPREERDAAFERARDEIEARVLDLVTRVRSTRSAGRPAARPAPPARSPSPD